MKKIYAVIMAGGSGTRFWPLSREKRPKQVLNLTGDQTLIQKTVDRILPVVDPEDIFIVTIAKQKNIISKLLPNVPSQNIIAEPYARNTTAAIGLAALHVKQRDPEGVMVVLPADHLVKNGKRFCKVLKDGAKLVCDHDRLVTLGLKPHYPETGYGYIQAGEEIKGKKGKQVSGSHAIKRFTEKPNLITAKRFVTRSDYYWNGGIFLWKTETILNEIKRYQPSIHKGLNQIEESFGKRGEKQLLNRTYKSFKKISIDNGVMEKTGIGAVIPCDIGWNDVGSWLALDEIIKKDKLGNAISGNFIGLDAKNCIVHTTGKTIVALAGVKDLIVVSTPDAVLICPKSKSQEVKEIVGELEKKGLKKYL